MTDQLPVTTDQPLPGLGDPDPTRYGATDLQLAVDRSLRYMAEQGIVDERHAGLMQLARTLAGAIRPGERAYGVAQAAAQLLATMDKLLPDTEGGATDGVNEIRAYLTGLGDARSRT